MPGIFTVRSWCRAASTASTTSPASCGVSSPRRVRGAQPRPVGPCAHARQVSLPPPVGSPGCPGGAHRDPGQRGEHGRGRAHPVRRRPARPRRPPRRPATRPARCRALTPVCTKPIASFSRDRGTDASIRENSAISVGARASPVTNRATRDDRQARQERQRDASRRPAAPAPIRARSSGPRCHVIAPATTPAIRLPREKAPSIRPEHGLVALRRRRRPPWPPRGRRTGCRGRSRRPSAARADPTASGRAAVGRVARVGGWLGAALHRQGDRAHRPATSATTSPAWGAKDVARRVTSAGPVTNTTSSATPSTANAVCRSLGARAGGPSGRGPWCRSGGSRRRRGRPAVRPRQRPVLDDRDDHQAWSRRAKTTASTYSTLRLAEPVGQPAVRDGEDRVADDVRRRDLPGQRVGAGQRATSSTMPSVIIEIGSRATSPVAEKATAPGWAKTRR